MVVNAALLLAPAAWLLIERESKVKCVAIIPARGGSKSVPRKNVLPLGGKPLIARTIETAQASNHVDRVLVTTDDPEIEDVALRYGAEVIRRPEELAGDEATSESALLHAIESLEKEEGIVPEILVFLQCTSPFTRAKDVDAIISRLDAEAADSAFSAVPFHGFIWKSTTKGPKGVNHDEKVRLRRQDRQSEYLEDGGIYVLRTEGFRVAKHRFFGKTIIHLVDPATALEIDSPNDMERAKFKLQEANAEIDFSFAAIKAIAFDFDGVFTDDRVLVDETGRESAICSRSDGMGIANLHAIGIPMVVISSEKIPIVARRSLKLSLEVFYGVDSKLDQLKCWLDTKGVRLEDTLYVGNDINDLQCMTSVGYPVSPSDGHLSVRAAAKVVLNAKGGRGAVRELADMIVKARLA